MSKKLQQAVSQYGKWLAGLASGEKVFVVYDDGDGNESIQVIGKTSSFRTDEKKVNVSAAGLRRVWGDAFFSRATGKMHGDDLYLRPYDETRAQAWLAEKAEAQRQYEEKSVARRAQREQMLLDRLESVDWTEVLNLLDDEKLRTLENIVEKAKVRA